MLPPIGQPPHADAGEVDGAHARNLRAPVLNLVEDAHGLEHHVAQTIELHVARPPVLPPDVDGVVLIDREQIVADH
eukprot:7391983-Prymnesium_polylepis.4